jgi:hypothetical protein
LPSAKFFIIKSSTPDENVKIEKNDVYAKIVEYIPNWYGPRYEIIFNVTNIEAIMIMT